MAPTEWTSWRPLRLAEDVPSATLAEQLDGGQSFRWSPVGDGSWVGVFGGTLAALRSGPRGLEWRAPKGAAKAEAALRHYLDADGAQEVSEERIARLSREVIEIRSRTDEFGPGKGPSNQAPRADS